MNKTRDGILGSEWRQVLGVVIKFWGAERKVSDIKKGRESLWLLNSELRGCF